MATERIDIIVREKGSRVVKRKLNSIGKTAENSVRSLRLLQNALFVLGGAGVLSGVIRLLDTMTNFENRLRLVTSSAADFVAIQKEVLDIAIRTRIGFEGTSQIFTRTALAVKELGISQQETLQFTESLNQATILSGAAARESNAALIQLSQGLASGTLRGDELRSVMEQLPFVADVIAKELKITRGELREFGEAGQISAEIVLRSFRNAREEIAEKFAKTIPTVSQAFSVLRTQLIGVLDKFDDLTGFSNSIAKAILSIGRSLESLIAGVTSATIAFAAFKIGTFLQKILAVAKANKEFTAAVKAGNATLLTSIEIEAAKSASSLKSAQATTANSLAQTAELRLTFSQLEVNKTLLLQQQAGITIDSTRRTARNALTGQFIAYDTALKQNIKTNIALNKTEQILLATKVELTTAIGVQTTATHALSSAEARNATALAATSTRSAKLARAFPTLAAGLALVRVQVNRLTLAIAANPFGAIAVAITAISALLFFFADDIKVTKDGVVSLKDVFVATFQLIGEAVAPLADFFRISFTGAIEGVSKGYQKLAKIVNTVFKIILGTIKRTINITIGLHVALIETISRSYQLLPAAIKDVLVLVYNSFLQFTEDSVNAVIIGFRLLPERIGSVFESISEFSKKTVQSIVDFFKKLPDAIKGIAGRAGEFLEQKFILAINKVKSLLNSLPGIALSISKEIGVSIEEAFTLPDVPDFSTFIQDGLLDLSSLKKETTGAAKEVLTIIEEEFSKGLSTDYLGDIFNAVIQRARKNAVDLTVGSSLDNTPEKTPVNDNSDNRVTLDEIISRLKTENSLLKLNSAERERARAVLEIESELKRSLLPIEKQRVDLLLQENQLLSRAAELFEDINAPATEYKETQIALNRLLQEGRIKQDQFNQSMRQARIIFLDNQEDFASGFERGFLKILERTGDVASQIENIVTGAFDSISQNIADLVVDGEANFGDLVKSINKQMIQLLVSQAFQQLFGNFGANTSGQVSGKTGLGGFFSNLFGFERGGSFTVGSQNGISPLPGNDNRLVAFRAKDGEDVTVTPKGQTPGGSSQPIIVQFNIQTPDVEGFRASQSQLAAKASRIIGKGRRNL